MNTTLASPGRPATNRQSGEPLTWMVWEARAHPGVAAAVVLLILVLCLGIYFSMASRYYATLALVVLLLAVLPYYLPTRYTLDEDGVEVRSLVGNRRKLWESLKVYFPDGERGLLLSPITRFGLLARTRGIYLLYRGNGPTARAYVAERLPEGRGSTK